MIGPLSTSRGGAFSLAATLTNVANIARLVDGTVRSRRPVSLFCPVLQPFSIRGLATPWTYFIHLLLLLLLLLNEKIKVA